jgi:hypothetical protein
VLFSLKIRHQKLHLVFASLKSGGIHVLINLKILKHYRICEIIKQILWLEYVINGLVWWNGL